MLDIILIKTNLNYGRVVFYRMFQDTGFKTLWNKFWWVLQCIHHNDCYLTKAKRYYDFFYSSKDIWIYQVKNINNI